MDLFLLTGIDNTPINEYFKILIEKDEDSCQPQKLTIKKVIEIFFQIIIMYFAASLSWGCSGKFPTAIRVLFAIFSAMFGMTYLVLYGVFRADLCLKN